MDNIGDTNISFILDHKAKLVRVRHIHHFFLFPPVFYNNAKHDTLNCKAIE